MIYFHMYEYVLNSYAVLRILGFPMVLCVYLFVQGEDPYLGIVLNTKETLPNFKENVLS